MVFQELELDASPRLFWTPVEVLPLRRRTAPATVVVVTCIKRLCPTGRSAIGAVVKMRDCLKEIGFIQKMHLQQGQKDIMQNFLICGNGTACEGRGWTKLPMLPGQYKEYNDQALYIGYVGDFTEENINEDMIKQRERLIMIGIRKKHLDPKFLYIDLANPWRKDLRPKIPQNYMSTIYM